MHCVVRVRECTVKIRAGIHTPRRHRSTNAGKRDGRASRTSGPGSRICLHSKAPSSSRRRCRRCRRVGMLGMSQSAVRTPVRRSRRIDRAEYDTQQSYRDERASSSACTAQLTGGARHMHQGEHDPADRQHTTPHPRKLAGTRGALKLRTSADVAHLLRGPGTPPRVYCIDTVRVLSGW